MKGSDSSNLEVTFYHFISDDKLKDTQFVISTKYELCMNHMPERIKKVQYRSDEEANLACTLHYLIQLLWEIWTGIIEEVAKHCPTGEGKSELDGNFGKTSHVLHNQHNLGFSFNDMESIVQALTSDDADVTGSTFGVFVPGRKFTFQGKIESEESHKSVLCSNLQTDRSVIIFQHSGYGNGTKIYSDLSSIKIKNKDGDVFAPITTCESPKKQSVMESESKLLSEYHERQTTNLHSMWLKWVEQQVIIAALASFPLISDQYAPSSTMRTKYSTILSEGCQGGGNELIRQGGRRRRSETKKDLVEYDLEKHRQLLLSKSVYSCTHKFSITM